MKEKNHEQASIWGKWWLPVRKWFYSIWLGYELTTRFYEYALSVHSYFQSEHDYLAAQMGNMGHQLLDLFCSVSTFVVCTIYLTIPACYVLFRFFQEKKPTQTRFEARFKRIF